jgi:hypothetical protein
MGDISIAWLHGWWMCVCLTKNRVAGGILPSHHPPSLPTASFNNLFSVRSRLRNINECETISPGLAAIFATLGDALQLRNVGSISRKNDSYLATISLAIPILRALSAAHSFRHLVLTLGVGFLKQNRNCLFCPLAPDLPSHSTLSSPGSGEHPIPARCAASWIIVDSTTIAC